MDMQSEQEGNNKPRTLKNIMSINTFLILMNCMFIAVGQLAGSMLMRTYFLHGGKRKWLQACLLSAGFPILILPIAISYAKRKKQLANTNDKTTRLFLTPKLLFASVIIGLLSGVCSYLYSFGMSYLPVSISSLLASTSLAFTAIFAYILVKHKFTHYSINAVVLMTFGSIILGLHMSGDRPKGESDRKYMLGVVMTLGGAALHGLQYAGVEYSYSKAGVPVTFDHLMQMQFLMSFFSTLFCLVAMIINQDFQAIPGEAKEFGLGQHKYYMIIALTALSLQVLIIGGLGLIFCSTALFLGIVNSLLIPVQQILAVVFLPESFSSDKWMALAMCLWAFASYFYGEYKVSLKSKVTKQVTQPDQV